MTKVTFHPDTIEPSETRWCRICGHRNIRGGKKIMSFETCDKCIKTVCYHHIIFKKCSNCDE